MRAGRNPSMARCSDRSPRDRTRGATASSVRPPASPRGLPNLAPSRLRPSHGRFDSCAVLVVHPHADHDVINPSRNARRFNRLALPAMAYIVPMRRRDALAMPRPFWSRFQNTESLLMTQSRPSTEQTRCLLLNDSKRTLNSDTAEHPRHRRARSGSETDVRWPACMYGSCQKCTFSLHNGRDKRGSVSEGPRPGLGVVANERWSNRIQPTQSFANRRRLRRRLRVVFLVLDEDRFESFPRPKVRSADFSQAGHVPI